MCGIFISCSSYCYRDPPDEILARLARRGPDSLRNVSRTISSKVGTYQPSWYLKATSSVLSLRSIDVVHQPVVDQHGQSESFLSWNGEAWRFDGSPLEADDTKFIYHRLVAAASSHCFKLQRTSKSANCINQGIVTALSKIGGPYAFAFYDSNSRILYYGRDALGRRSLLIRWPSHSAIEISSIGGDRGNGDWREVDAGGIYVLDLALKVTSGQAINSSSRSDKSLLPMFIPYQTEHNPNFEPISLQAPFPCLNKDLIPDPPMLNAASPVLKNLHHHVQKSLALRLGSAPINSQQGAQGSRVAILFSGGVDCTLIARIANDVLSENQEIDLLNVAFENPRVAEAARRNKAMNSATNSSYELCPDRLTGRKSYQELIQLCPRRVWRFVSIDIPYGDTEAHTPEIMTLLHPHKTEMDLSIGRALYFAARGRGKINMPEVTTEVPYTTPARVLISGLGADELFGGYTRHATAFFHRGHAGLVEELALDFERLSIRNLGRDDRLMSHWGKEVRYPFLDEELVIWALSLPIWEKCSFVRNSNGLNGLGPGKSVLRLLAWKLGLKSAASEKKRAIQFGARTAKMEPGRRKGTDTLE